MPGALPRGCRIPSTTGDAPRLRENTKESVPGVQTPATGFWRGQRTRASADCALLRGWKIQSPARDAPRLRERTQESVPGVQTPGTGFWRGHRTRASADARRSAPRLQDSFANGRRALYLEKGRKNPFQRFRPRERAPGAAREPARQRMPSALLRGWRIPSATGDAPRPREGSKESVPRVQTPGRGFWRGQTRASANARRSAPRLQDSFANGRRAQTSRKGEGVRSSSADPWNGLLARPENSRVNGCQALCSAAGGSRRQRATRPDLMNGRASPFQGPTPLQRAPGAAREPAR